MLFRSISQSVEAWASWKTWHGRSRKVAGEGRIAPIVAQTQGSGESATLDDEENVARLLSDDLIKALLPSIEAATTPAERTAAAAR